VDEDELAIKFEAEIYDEEVAEKIRLGLIRHVSIAADYEFLEPVVGVISRGLRFRELSLVAVPSVPEANIEIVERPIERWRDGERPGKIALTALGRYPLGPEDISVPGLDGEGKLRLSQISEKAGSLSELALERSWEADKLLLESEVFAGPSSLRLRGEICDYSGRKLTDLVSSSNEISAEGLIRPGAITAEKLADGIDASTKGLRAADADTLDGYYVHELTLDLILGHGNRTEHDIEFSSATAGPVLLDRATGEKWRLYVEDGILRLEKIA